MIPAILQNISIILTVALDRTPKIVLTKNEHNAKENEEVVHLMMQFKKLVVVDDAVALEDGPDRRQFLWKHVHSVGLSACYCPCVSLLMTGIGRPMTITLEACVGQSRETNLL